MASFVRESPRAFRGLLIALGLLTMFLFFDPIGFASSSMASHMPPATTRSVTHIVMFQFKPGADHAAVDTVPIPLCHSIRRLADRLICLGLRGDAGFERTLPLSQLTVSIHQQPHGRQGQFA